MAPPYCKLCLTLPLLTVALLSQPRPAAKYTTFVLQSGSATLNSQGVTGNFSAVYEGGGLPTDTYFDDAVIYGTSIFTLQNGGSAEQLSGGAGTTINIQGGSLPGGVAELGAGPGSYTLNVSGGNVFSIDLPTISGTTTISGGTIGYFQTYSASTVDITGGSVGLAGGFDDEEPTVFNISGGTIGNFTTARGGLNLYGSGLTYQNGQVTGFLTDGTPIDSIVPIDGLIVVGNSNHLTFATAPVPETSTSVSLGLLLLVGGAAAFYSSRRRRA